MKITTSGAVVEKFQQYLPMAEETASVGKIQKLLKQQLKYEVVFQDVKHLPVIAGETKQGKFC